MNSYKLKNLDDYIGVVLLLLVSDAICFLYYLTPFTTFFIFFVYSLYRYIRYRGHIEHKFSVFYFIIFGVTIFLNIFVVNINIINNNGLAILLCLIASYFFYATYSFNRFKEIYLNIICLIVITGVPVYLLSQVHLLPTYKLLGFEGSNHTMFLIYHLGWPKLFSRFSGIWHEPGACMIFLNLAVLLYSIEIRKGILQQKVKNKLIIVSIGVLATQSTTGYLAFALIIIYCYFPQLKKAKASQKILGLLLGTLLVFFLLNSSVVSDKFGQERTGNSSLAVRRMDNLSMLSMAMEKPFWGYGYGTKEFDKMSYLLDNKTSSNGILYIAACAGIWWVFLFVFFIYYGCRKKKLPQPFFCLIIFLLLQCNERFVELPISYLLIASYLSNKKVELIKQNLINYKSNRLKITKLRKIMARY